MGIISKLFLGLAVAWLVFVIYSYTTAFVNVGTFEQTLKGDCPSLNIHILPNQLNRMTISRKEWVNLIAWHDKKTGEEIFITPESYRQYRSTFQCDKKLVNANMKLSQVQSGEVEPSLNLKWGYFVLILFLPTIVLVGLAYFFKVLNRK